MIYSITFNPALDVSGVVDQMIPDEKVYVHDELHMAGGNGINAGVIAHRLGSQVILSGFMGGPNGEEIESLLENDKIRHQFIEIKGHTRMNLTISNQDDHRQSRLSFPGPKILGTELKKLETLLKKVKADDLVILGGSLPPGVAPTFVKKLVKSFHRKRVKCIVDVPGDLLEDIIKSHPSFIKPNLSEFQLLIGKRPATIKTILPYAQKILKFVPTLCISSVEGGALLLNKDEVWFGKIPKVKIQSTVGAGDSMVGAMAHLWNKNPETSFEDLLRLGLAASCATLTERGLTLGTKKNILGYSEKIILKKII